MNCCWRFALTIRANLSFWHTHLLLMLHVKMIHYVTRNKPKTALQIQLMTELVNGFVNSIEVDKWNQSKWKLFYRNKLCLVLFLLTGGESSLGLVRPTPASPPHLECLEAAWWQSWSWRGWTPRLPVLDHLWSLPSGWQTQTHTHIRKKEQSLIAWCVQFRCPSMNKSSTPICTSWMGWEKASLSPSIQSHDALPNGL